MEVAALDSPASKKAKQRFRRHLDDAKKKIAARASRNTHLAREHPWLPVGTIGASDRLTWDDWLHYRLCRAQHHQQHPTYSLTFWNRFKPETTRRVWGVLHDLAPNLDWREYRGAFPRLQDLSNDDDRHECKVATMQAITTAFALMVKHGRTGKRVTFNDLFDALAAKFSDNYRAVKERGRITTIWDCSIKTVRRVRRDLVRNGISPADTWKLVKDPAFAVLSEKESEEQGEHSKLYRIVQVLSFDDHADESHTVQLLSSPAAVALERILDADEAMLDGGRNALLLRTETLPAPYEHREICAEKPFNVVPTGARERDTMAALSTRVTLLLNQTAVMTAYRAAEAVADAAFGMLMANYGTDPSGLHTKVPSRREERVRTLAAKMRGGALTPNEEMAVIAALRQYDAATAYLSANKKMIHREIAPRVEQRETLDKILGGAPALRNDVEIQTGWFKVLNRRIEPTHYWPGRVADDTLWERLAQQAENMLLDAPGLVPGDTLRRNFFRFPGHPLVAGGKPIPMDGLDVASSREQILATALNLEALKKAVLPVELGGGVETADGRIVPLKQYKRETAWKYVKQHGYTGRLIDDGYTSSDDPRFKEMVKKLGHARGYGGEIGAALKEFRESPYTYGPGFLGEEQKDQIENVRRYEAGLPDELGLERFRKACARAAQVAYRIGRATGDHTGVEIVDLYSEVVQRWDTPQQVDVRIQVGGSGGSDLILKAPGGNIITVAGVEVRSFLDSLFFPNGRGGKEEVVVTQADVVVVCGQASQADLTARIKNALTKADEERAGGLQSAWRQYKLPNMADKVLPVPANKHEKQAGELAKSVLNVVRKRLLKKIEKEGAATVRDWEMWKVVREACRATRRYKPPKPSRRVITDFVTGKRRIEAVHPIDSGEVRRQVAPCLTHNADALFNLLVIELALKIGLPIVPVHDSWLVPQVVYISGSLRRGVDVLKEIIKTAGQEWLQSLGPFFDFFIDNLDSAEDYLTVQEEDTRLLTLDPPASSWSDWARTRKAEWKAQVQACRAGAEEWPNFFTESAFEENAAGNWWSGQVDRTT